MWFSLKARSQTRPAVPDIVTVPDDLLLIQGWRDRARCHNHAALDGVDVDRVLRSGRRGGARVGSRAPPQSAAVRARGHRESHPVGWPPSVGRSPGNHAMAARLRRPRTAQRRSDYSY